MQSGATLLTPMSHRNPRTSHTFRLRMPLLNSISKELFPLLLSSRRAFNHSSRGRGMRYSNRITYHRNSSNHEIPRSLTLYNPSPRTRYNNLSPSTPPLYSANNPIPSSPKATC
mmetsp:Transcript_39039/g.74950  ORF Transcript_39039/g.74950 Transcript_39039/m.74950 type:complete len:114 (+) Transcript_39039:933-1274(+)